jgi:transposase
MGRKRDRYTAEQKQEAIRLVKVSGRPVVKVAEDLGIPQSTLWRWLAQARIDAGEGPPGALTSAERAELAKLRRENRTLRMERDFLKKAAAFFAKDKAGGSK